MKKQESIATKIVDNITSAIETIPQAVGIDLAPAKKTSRSRKRRTTAKSKAKPKARTTTKA